MKGAETNGEPHETLARSRKRVRGTPDEDQDYRALDAGTIVQCPICQREFDAVAINALSLIHISEPTRRLSRSRMPSSA